MLKNVLLIAFSLLFFTACSFKMPSFPSFSSSKKDDLTKFLEEANECQKLEEDEKKLVCYKNIEDKNSFAQIRLGTYNADKRDFSAALKYLNKAKQSGNIYANLPLAFLYYKGEGISKDIPKSFELLQESADTDPVAAFQLARFYLQGINTKVDNEKGVKYLELAASKNVSLALDITISTYKEGLFGQPKDQKKVEFWENKRDQNIEDTNYDIYKI